MKTDRVLTLCEYLDQWGVVSMHVAPPADNACHVPITSEADICPTKEEPARNCDRWGHPCPTCVNPNAETKVHLNTQEEMR